MTTENPTPETPEVPTPTGPPNPSPDPAPTPVAEEPTPTTAVVPKGETGLAVLPDYGSDADQYGTEEFDQDGVLRSIKLLTSQNNECIEGTDEFVTGAKPGMWYNPNSGRLYKQLPVCFLGRDNHYNEWIEIDAGGGFVGRMEVNDPRVALAKKITGKNVGRLLAPDENGQPIPTHEIVERTAIPVIIFDPETWDPIDEGTINIERSKYPPYNNYIDDLKRAAVDTGRKDSEGIPIMAKVWGKVPLFGYRVLIGSELETKPKKGKPYYFPTFTPAVDGDIIKSLLPRSHGLYVEAKRLIDRMRAGEIRVETAEDEGQQTVDAQFEVVGETPVGTDGLPF